MTSIFGSTLVRLRRFLSLVQVAPYKVPEDVQKMVEDDFVAARADGERVSYMNELWQRGVGEQVSSMNLIHRICYG